MQNNISNEEEIPICPFRNLTGYPSCSIECNTSNKCDNLSADYKNCSLFRLNNQIIINQELVKENELLKEKLRNKA